MGEGVRIPGVDSLVLNLQHVLPSLHVLFLILITELRGIFSYLSTNHSKRKVSLREVN